MSNVPEKRVPLTPQMLFGGAAGALLVISAGCAVAYFTDGDWSDAAGWIEALATVAAFGAAVLAAILVGRTLELELQREDQRLQSDRSGQAALVAAWPKCHLGDGDYDTDPDGTEFWRTSDISGAILKLRNASPVPVTSVRVDVETTLLAATGAIVGTVESVYRTAFLPPQAEPIEVQVWGPNGVKVPQGLLIQANGELHENVSIELNFYFTDAAGVRWHRSAKALRSGLEAVPPEKMAATF